MRARLNKRSVQRGDICAKRIARAGDCVEVEREKQGKDENETRTRGSRDRISGEEDRLYCDKD